MKKIILFLCIIVAAAVGTIVFLMLASPNTQTKFAKDEIIFTTITNKNGEFISNYTYSSGTPTYEIYKIKISNIKNVAFENPYISHSTNVFLISQNFATGIEISFQITNGKEFYFEIQSNNFETARMLYHAREYIQSSSLNLKVATSPTGTFTDLYEGNNVIYIIDNQHKNTALLDGFASEIWVLPYSSTHPGADFAVDVAASGHLLLSGNQAPYRLTAKDVGSSQFNFYSLDGSGTGKSEKFVCKYVAATGISGLPGKIDIDMSTQTQYILQNYTVLPIYAKNYSLTFESTNPNVFTVENDIIRAVDTGYAEIWAKVDGKVISKIPVTITFTQQPKFTFSINSITAEQFAQNITLNDDLLCLNIANLHTSFISITIDVGIDNFGGVIEDINTNITNPNNILFTPAGPPAFGIGSKTYIPFTIVVSKTEGSLYIEFSKIIDGKTISKILVINIINI